MDEQLIKVLVVSDTHGDTRLLKEVVRREAPFDVMIHCGDTGTDLEGTFPQSPFKIYAVNGNCDYHHYPDSIDTKIGPANFWITHGHKYDIKRTARVLQKEAEKKHADIVCFGHTHVQESFRINNILYVNPGSLRYPRESGPSYAVITLDPEIYSYKVDLKILNF